MIHHSIFLSLLFITLCACMPWFVYGGRRRSCRSQFVLPSWGTPFELRLTSVLPAAPSHQLSLLNLSVAMFWLCKKISCFSKTGYVLKGKLLINTLECRALCTLHIKQVITLLRSCHCAGTDLGFFFFIDRKYSSLSGLFIMWIQYQSYYWVSSYIFPPSTYIFLILVLGQTL